MGFPAAHGSHAGRDEVAGRAVFAPEDIAAMRAWSDRIIIEIETRTGFILGGAEVAAQNLRAAPPSAKLKRTAGETA